MSQSQPKNKIKISLKKPSDPTASTLGTTKIRITIKAKAPVIKEDNTEFLHNMQPYVFDTVSSFGLRSKLNSVKGALAHIELLQTQLLESLNWDSSIYFRLAEDNIGDSQFIIAGASDTPYHNGLFLYSMVLPYDYPLTAPSIRLLSTGYGKIRMNPNLYADGKVCLSLLGTWDGPGWTTASNISQVLLAIQAQIMNSMPLRNEPTYENIKEPVCNIYNAVIRINTIKIGIIDILKHPPFGFEEMILSFFTSKKKTEIAKQLASWVNMAKALTATQPQLHQHYGYLVRGSVLLPDESSSFKLAPAFAEFKKNLVEKTIEYANIALTLLGESLILG